MVLNLENSLVWFGSWTKQEKNKFHLDMNICITADPLVAHVNCLMWFAVPLLGQFDYKIFMLT